MACTAKNRFRSSFAGRAGGGRLWRWTTLFFTSTEGAVVVVGAAEVGVPASLFFSCLVFPCFVGAFGSDAGRLLRKFDDEWPFCMMPEADNGTM